MKRFLVALTFLVLFFVNYTHAQPSYIKTFGDPKDKPLIFLHGGPGSNAGSFEVTTAEQISAMGYFVVVYDRRGEGRSVDHDAKYTFRQTFRDLNAIYRKYDIKKATLIGYSFGGLVGTLYAEKYSEKVSSLVLLSSLLSLQDTYATIIAKSDSIFKVKNDTIGLKAIAATKEMDSSSFVFRTYCFAFATQNGFFKTPHPNELSVALNKKLASDTTLTILGQYGRNSAAKGFLYNEKYTTLDISPKLELLKNKHINIFAFYGKDDGLFSPAQLERLKSQLGNDHVWYLDDCSHAAFIDQQTLFMEAIASWVR